MPDEIDQSTTPRVGIHVRFGVLGPVTVSDGSTTLGIGGPKQRAVLAMLISRAGHPVSLDAIIEAVWGDEALSNARRNVQTYVATLRSELGDAIVKESYGWRLAVDREEVDALAFEDFYESAHAAIESNPERASVALREALAIWRGHPYADIDAHGALDGEIARLTELRAAAQAARIEADLALGRDADLIGEIEALLVEHPYSEQFRAQHMLALYRAGRQQEALRSYGEMRTILLEELGVEPTPDLQRLEVRILEQDSGLHAAPVRTVSSRAILVVDPGDPIEIGHLPAAERDELLDRTSFAVRSVVDGRDDATVMSAGTTTYLVLESALTAARVAQGLVDSAIGRGLRLAIDWGDVVIDDEGVSGAPVSRAAVMAAVGHERQVLLSADAQQAIGSDAAAGAFRFETLGSHQLHGVDDEVLIYQLLMEGQATFPGLQTHRLPPPLPSGESRSVPGYELRTPFAPGSIGMLHRAFQPSVGREVLVEVIGRAQSSGADFVRNFEADAQRLALLDHQNLASVIDYWRRPDGAFLVYRFPRGGSLADRPIIDPNRVIDQVGSALTYAHSFGMVHGSVRPDRVLLDEAGNGSLIGFPIAGIAPRASTGFAAYIAPELLSGRSASVAADVFALGVLVHELRSGPIESDAPLRSDDPAIARAISDEPSARQPSVSEFLANLLPSGEAETAVSADRYTETRNPYKGLAAFHERDAQDFFGRTAAVEELVRAMTQSRLLAIVGPSGIGKSSVARAGLIPALRSGALPGSETWMITDMLPGSHPFMELQRALERVAVDLPLELTEALAARRPSSLQGVARLLPDQAGSVVVIDQFEELFTLTDEDERAAFLDLITTTVDSGDVRFIVTLRADFLDQPLRYSEFGELLRRSVVMLRAPSTGELAEAISRPAQQVGVHIDPALVQRIVAEVHDQPGALPLLQHALGELFEARRSDVIDVDAFDRLGGISGSLARRAESIYESLDTDTRHRISQAFLRLVTVSDDGPPTRRRLRLTDLDDLAVSDAIDAFARARLLVYDNDPESRSPTVEVSHEALLTHWPRLAGWIDATREELVLSRRLTEAIQDWEASQRSDAYLLTRGRLAQHQTWTQDTNLAITPIGREFLERSAAHDAELRRRRRRRRNLITTAFAAAAVVATAFGLVAVRNARTADQNAERAKAEALAASALAAIEEDPELSVLLGIEALELNADSRAADEALNQAIQAHRTIFRLDPPETDSRSAKGSISPDGRYVVTSWPEGVQLWEVGDSTEPLWEVQAEEDIEHSEAYFSHDGEYVVASIATNEFCIDDRWLLIDAGNGAIVEDRVFPGLLSYVSGPAQSGPFVHVNRAMILGDGVDGRCLGAPPIADLVGVNLITGQQEILGRGATFHGTDSGMPTLSADGSRLATAGDGIGDEGGAVIDLTTGIQLLELPVGLSSISPEGDAVLAGQGPLELHDVESGKKLREFPGEDFSVAWFSPSGTKVYGATSDGRVLIFDRETAVPLLELRGQGGETRNVQMSDDETRLATFATDGTVRVWDVGTPLMSTTGPESFDAQHGDESAYFFVDDTFAMPESLVAGRALLGEVSELTGESVVGAFAMETAIYDAESGAVKNTYPGSVVAVSNDGQMVAFHETGPLVELTTDEANGPGSEGFYTPVGRFQIAVLETGRTITELEGLCDWFFAGQERVVPDECGPPGPWREYTQAGSFSPDDSMFAMTGSSGRFAVWDASTGEMLWTRDTEDGEDQEIFGQFKQVKFTPDGRHLVFSDFLDVIVLEVGSWEPVAEFEFEASLSGMEFTPDSRMMVVTEWQSLDVVVIDTETWTEVARLTGQQGFVIPDIAIDPTGRFVATAGRDNESRVWDLETFELARRITIPPINLGMRNIDWVDEQTLLIGTRRTAAMFTLDPHELLLNARGRLTRSFTPEECVTYDIEPCPTLEEMRHAA